MFCTSCGHPRQDGDVFCTSCGANVSGAAVAVAAPQLSFAGYAAPAATLIGVPFWPRAGARLIDFAVHYLIAVLSAFALGLVIGIAVAAAGGNVQAVSQHVFGDTGIAASAFAIVGAAVFSMLCNALHGSSPGKLMLGMVVLQEDRTPCGARGAIIRELGYFVDALFFGAIGYQAMKESPLQQRYGDKWGKTIVVKRAQAPPAALRGNGRFFGALVVAAVADSVLITLPFVMKLF
jgi:uncharacterized RDD family membrane protein YckC